MHHPRVESCVINLIIIYSWIVSRGATAYWHSSVLALNSTNVELIDNVLGEELYPPHGHGQGYGQELLRLLCRHAFEGLDLHKVWIVHYADNQRMRHVCDKLGFVSEGLMRDEYFHAETWHDMQRHSLLRREYDTAPWRQPTM